MSEYSFSPYLKTSRKAQELIIYKIVLSGAFLILAIFLVLFSSIIKSRQSKRQICKDEISEIEGMIVQSYLLNTAHSYNASQSSKKIGSLDSGSLNKQYLKAKYTLSEIEKEISGYSATYQELARLKKLSDRQAEYLNQLESSFQLSTKLLEDEIDKMKTGIRSTNTNSLSTIKKKLNQLIEQTFEPIQQDLFAFNREKNGFLGSKFFLLHPRNWSSEMLLNITLILSGIAGTIVSILIYPQKDLKKILVHGPIMGIISLFLVQGGISWIISGNKLNIDESLNPYMLTFFGLIPGMFGKKFLGVLESWVNRWTRHHPPQEAKENNR